MKELKNFYDILGIDPDSSLEDIKRAFKDMAKVWHPDRFPNDPRLQAKAQEKLKEIIGAYRALLRYHEYMEAEKAKYQAPSKEAKKEENSFRDRVLCSDGSCMGIINEKGFCKVCGKPYNPESGFDDEKSTRNGSASQKPSPPGASFPQNKGLKNKRLFQGFGLIAFAILIAIGIYIYNQPSTKPTQIPISSKWVSINYSELIDRSAIIQTGQTLGSVLSKPGLKGALQPFLDKYSYLLQYSIEMIHGPDPFPHQNVVDHFPIGSKQPAWVGVFRGGRIFLTTDNKNHARLFLLGEDPKVTYQNNYSVVRHCLSALLPADGSPLKVEVFAYKNDYQKSQLSLNLNPYSFESPDFPPQSRTVSLDLTGLEDFFRKGGQLEGGELDQKEGLILYAKKRGPQTLAGERIALSDFSVAYRAVFHAGDNEAFISLDPHKDSTKVAVNFGGFLEDTRIGRVVLEADKRFKTISSGLDPNTFKDIRNYSRRIIPTFRTVDERDISGKSFGKKGWIGTRFWFYPDSIEVESDLEYKYALITKPQFLADAERSKDDFSSLDEFEKKKKSTLSPAILQNITHLNNNYSEYENAYSELKELTTVARLMAICIWLQKAKANWVDFDSLLSVDLPSYKTEEDKLQMLTCSTLAYNTLDDIDDKFIIKNIKIRYLTPLLDKTLKEIFSNSTNFSKYLCIRNNEEENLAPKYISEAKDFISQNSDRKIFEILKDKEDLKAFLTFVSGKQSSLPPSVAILISENEMNRAKLEELESKLEKIKSEMNKITDRSIYNSYVDAYNRLTDQYERTRNRYNQNVMVLNKAPIKTQTMMRINGGINLSPRNFKINKSSSSPKLIEFKNITAKADFNWKSIGASGEWIKSGSLENPVQRKRMLPKINWIPQIKSSNEREEKNYFESDHYRKYWFIRNEKGLWRDYCFDSPVSREKLFDKEEKVLKIAEFKDGKISKVIQGRLASDNQIIFSKVERKDLYAPKEAPIWFKN